MDKSQSSIQTYVLYKRRHVMLGLLCVALFLNGELWISLPSITAEVSVYLNKTYQDINWFSNVFPIILMIEAIPSMYIPSFLGLRYCLIIGSILHSISTILRFSSVAFSGLNNNDKFVLKLVGCISAALTQGFILNLPPSLSLKWFPRKDRQLSTSVCYSANFLGVAFGFFFSISILSAVEAYYDRTRGLLVIYACEMAVALTTMIVTIVFARNEPLTPPDDDTESMVGAPEDFISRSNFKNALINIWKYFFSLNNTLILISFGFYYCLSTLYYTILSEIADQYIDVKPAYLGYMGSVAVIGGAVATLSFGYILSKYKQAALKKLSIISFSICIIISIAFCSLVKTKTISAGVMFGLTIIYGCFAAPYNSVGIEQLVSLCPEVQPHLICSICLIVANVFTSVLIYSIGYIELHSRYFVSFLLLIFGYSFGLFTSVFVTRKVAPDVVVEQ